MFPWMADEANSQSDSEVPPSSRAENDLNDDVETQPITSIDNTHRNAEDELKITVANEVSDPMTSSSQIDPHFPTKSIPSSDQQDLDDDGQESVTPKEKDTPIMAHIRSKLSILSKYTTPVMVYIDSGVRSKLSFLSKYTTPVTVYDFGIRSRLSFLSKYTTPIMAYGVGIRSKLSSSLRKCAVPIGSKLSSSFSKCAVPIGSKLSSLCEYTTPIVSKISSLSKHKTIRTKLSILSIYKEKILICVAIILTQIVAIIIIVHAVKSRMVDKQVIEVSGPDGPNTPQDSLGSVSPSPRPSAAPVSPPLVDDNAIIKFLESNLNITLNIEKESSEHVALQYMMKYDYVIYNTKLAQRFALIALDFSLTDLTQDMLVEDGDKLPFKWTVPILDECHWKGVVCDEGLVTELDFARLDLVGTVPSVISLLPNLRHIDMSSNLIRGSIPEELYELTHLTSLYLYKNQFTGTLSARVGELDNLLNLYLNHNNFSGPIPRSLRSLEEIKPLRYLNLYRNQFTGTIPKGLRLRHLFLLDLGHNELTGTLPEDLGSTFIRLRHLHLDNNHFVGTIPPSYTRVGNSRLESFTIENNQLTGSVPSNYARDNLVVYTLYNNDFTADLDKEICRLSVFDSGELVELKSDCDICTCGEGFVCEHCYE